MYFDSNDEMYFDNEEINTSGFLEDSSTYGGAKGQGQ